mmetsp:Transcript_22798/g.68674  ORF Transcript_22798/g.68674 Transcript_22798/m.68674 type:complete len:159 (-) Transcript_22798:41-517(-)
MSSRRAETVRFLHELGMDSRWFIVFNMVTLVVVLSNRREDGTLKYRWSEAMVPTYTHDALAIFAAFTVNHPARQNRAMHELDPPRPPHATSAYRLLHRPYFVAVAILKLSFDVCATVWASGDGDLTAMQVAIPGLMLLALVSIKHVAMQWLVRRGPRH